MTAINGFVPDMPIFDQNGIYVSNSADVWPTVPWREKKSSGVILYDDIIFVGVLV